MFLNHSILHLFFYIYRNRGGKLTFLPIFVADAAVETLQSELAQGLTPTTASKITAFFALQGLHIKVRLLLVVLLQTVGSYKTNFGRSSRFGLTWGWYS